jgi:hypothetical protein
MELVLIVFFSRYRSRIGFELTFLSGYSLPVKSSLDSTEFEVSRPGGEIMEIKSDYSLSSKGRLLALASCQHLQSVIKGFFKKEKKEDHPNVKRITYYYFQSLGERRPPYPL